MKLRKIVEDLSLKPLNEEETAQGDSTMATGFAGDREVTGCYIGDLLSNVMSHAEEGDLWLTVQTNQNVVAIAQLLNLSGIVFLEGHLPQPETITRANQEKIFLFGTNDSAYEVAVCLSKLGLEGKP